jgi:hypothetical protein
MASASSGRAQGAVRVGIGLLEEAEPASLGMCGCDTEWRRRLDRAAQVRRQNSRTIQHRARVGCETVCPIRRARMMAGADFLVAWRRGVGGFALLIRDVIPKKAERAYRERQRRE